MDDPSAHEANLDLEQQVQYSSLGESAGFVELAGWTSIAVTGRDGQKFLNNFCTNDVRRLAPGENCEAFFTNVKGKIVGHGVITCREDELVMTGVPGQAANLIEHLNRYVILDDVQLRDTTSERTYVLLAGGSSARGVAVSLAQTIGAGNEMLKPNINAAFAELDYPLRWIHSNVMGMEFSGLFEVAPPLLSRLRMALADRGAALCETGALDTRRIEAGTPLFGVDFDERNFPQEVGRDQQAISFTKGCYLGQETVARIDALGHVNQRIAGIKFAASKVPASGTELKHNNSVAGHVTSATFSPRLNAPLALAMVRREHAGVGTILESVAGACEVIELPLPN